MKRHLLQSRLVAVVGVLLLAAVLAFSPDHTQAASLSASPHLCVSDGLVIPCASDDEEPDILRVIREAAEQARQRARDVCATHGPYSWQCQQAEEEAQAAEDRYVEALGLRRPRNQTRPSDSDKRVG